MRPLDILRTALLLTLIPLFSACDSLIYSDEGDCDPVHRIRFKYDWNLKFADAFPSEVPSVTVYLFDQSGNVVLNRSEHVTADRAGDFYIELRDIPRGHYDILAWCGIKDSEHFTVNHAGVDDPKFEHHTCRIERESDVVDASGHIRRDIGRLFHGRLTDIDMTQDEGTYDHVVSLKKNTNVIRVVLQHLSGAPLDKDAFTFEITDANGLMASTNELMADDDITYHPWMQRAGIAEFHPEDQPATTAESRAQTSSSAIVTEFTVGRLMADRNAILTVRAADNGRTILSIPVNEYALMVRGNYYEPGGRRPLTDQEYLDRQDEYPMTFFIDHNNEWIKSFIYINSWRVVLNNTGIH